MSSQFLRAALTGLLWMASPVAAFAQDQNAPDDAQEAIVPEPTAGRRQPHPRDLSLQMGLGISNYNGNLADNVDPGPAWDLRGTFMNREIVGAELAYSGATNNLEGQDPGRPGADLNGSAMTSAGDAMARLNMSRNAAVQPFVTAGIGVLGLDFRDDDTTVDRGSALTIPMGAGLQFYTPGRFTFGGRFNYRVLTDVINNDLPNGDHWNVGLNAGATF